MGTDWRAKLLEDIGRRDLINADTSQILALSIEPFRLSTKTRNILNDQGIKTVGDLVARKTSDFKQLRGVGKKFFEEIEAIVQGLNLEFVDEVKKPGTYVTETDMSQRIQLRLARRGIETVEEITNLTEAEIREGKIGKDLGKKDTANLLNWLAQNGYTLRQERDELTDAMEGLGDAVKARNAARTEIANQEAELRNEARRTSQKADSLSNEDAQKLARLLEENSDLLRQAGVYDEIAKAARRDENATQELEADNNR